MAKFVSKGISIFLIISQVIGIILFAVMMKSSIEFWQTIFKQTTSMQSKLFWISILLAIVHSIIHFIIIFINSIGGEIKRLNE